MDLDEPKKKYSNNETALNSTGADRVRLLAATRLLHSPLIKEIALIPPVIFQLMMDKEKNQVALNSVDSSTTFKVQENNAVNQINHDQFAALKECGEKLRAAQKPHEEFLK